jgi:L-alanine-DL-glutamate epimerase-like enolase superfamily enzyme
MKIAKIDVFQKTYTLAEGTFVISGGKVASNEDSTIVRIETDEGLVGWGEQCVFSPNYLVAHGEGARAALTLLAPAIIGMDPTQIDIIYQKMESTLKGHQYIKSAIDIACWDLLGKASGLRISDLLGGTYREQIPLYAPISMGSPEEMRASCEKKTAAGYKRFQMKVGGDWRTDVSRVHACLEVLDNPEKVIFDANGNWTQHEATQIVAKLTGLDIYIEQPCATAEECARVRKRTTQPFILDESLLTSMDVLNAYRLEAMDAVMLKLSRFGGITPIKRARDLCALLGLAVSIEDSGGGDIVSAAMAHLSASTPTNLFMNGFFVGNMVVERLTEWSCLTINGMGILPNGPGLGIVVDEQLLGKPLHTYR